MASGLPSVPHSLRSLGSEDPKETRRVRVMSVHITFYFLIFSYLLGRRRRGMNRHDRATDGPFLPANRVAAPPPVCDTSEE